MLDLEQIVRKVAEEHRIILGKDDPVLAFVAMNEMILEKYGETLNEVLQKEAERLGVCFSVAAKQMASHLGDQLNGCLERGQMEIRSMHTDAYRQMHLVLQEHINVIGRLNEETNRARLLAWLGAALSALLLTFQLVKSVFT